MSPGKRKRKSPSKDKFADRVIKYFQGTVPDWPLYMLCTLMIGALKSLRHYIESEDAPDANWENPFAELQFPARWDWKASQIIFIDAFDQKHAEEREEEFIDSVFDYHIAQVFWAITNGAMLYKEGQDLFPILEQEVWDVIRSLPEDDGKEKLTELYQPFAIGCIPVPIDERSDNDRSGSDHDGLREILEDIPKLQFACSVGDNIISGTMMFVFQPLVVNADEHRAYYPILTGLVFDDPDAALLMSQLEQGEFWGRLLQQCDDICSSMLPGESTEGTESRSVVLNGIERDILPVYRPWIQGVHESALAYFEKSGELPALRLPHCRVPQEADQDDNAVKQAGKDRDRTEDADIGDVVFFAPDGYSFTVDGRTHVLKTKAQMIAVDLLRDAYPRPLRWQYVKGFLQDTADISEESYETLRKVFRRNEDAFDAAITKVKGSPGFYRLRKRPKPKEPN